MARNMYLSRFLMRSNPAMQIDTDRIAAAVKQSRVVGHWRSSALGAAVLALAVLQSLKFDVAGHLCMSAQDWTAIGLGVLAGVVGAASKDAQ